MSLFRNILNTERMPNLLKLVELNFLQLYLLERKFADANPILHQTGPMIEAWVQANTHQIESVAKQQKEYLQIFFLVLQVQ